METGEAHVVTAERQPALLLMPPRFLDRCPTGAQFMLLLATGIPTKRSNELNS
jgi:hypothetical protein